MVADAKQAKPRFNMPLPNLEGNREEGNSGFARTGRKSYPCAAGTAPADATCPRSAGYFLALSHPCLAAAVAAYQQHLAATLLLVVMALGSEHHLRCQSSSLDLGHGALRCNAAPHTTKCTFKRQRASRKAHENTQLNQWSYRTSCKVLEQGCMTA